MNIGTLFSSAEELKAAIRRFEQQNYVNLSILNSRSLIATHTKKHENANPSLCYSRIWFQCIHGGKFRPKSAGIRKRPDDKPFVK